MQDLQKNIDILLQNEDGLSPLSITSRLTAQLMNNRNTTDDSDKLDHTEKLLVNGGDINDAFVNSIGGDFCSALGGETLNKVISYIFNRRFGWTEGGKFLNGKTLSTADAEEQEEEQALLDQLIHWLSCQNIQKIIVEGLTDCIRNAKDKPVVRNQTCIHLMEWYKYQLYQYEAKEAFRENYQYVKTSVLLVLQDIWSAIRKACAARLGQIMQYFTIAQLEDFFNDLIAICNTENSSWQSVEGAVMGLHITMKKLQWKSFSKPEYDGKHYSLQFGNEEVKCMPDFISSQMYQTVFKLLSHPQLTVREHAIKTFTAYISKCELKTAISCLRDVIGGLCKGIDLEKYSLPHTSITDPNFKFMDAYEAEGLLGVCVYLIKYIPPCELLITRPLYFSTFSLYLMHPASTVRQATSTVFKFMVAKDSSSPSALKFILQSLCCEWLPDMDLLLCCEQNTSKPRHSVTALKKSNAEASDCWEWREGRLLAYELIMQFLIKNHWLYTFGASHLLNDSIDSPRGQSKERRKSLSEDKPVHASLSNPIAHKSSKDPVSRLVGEDETIRTRTSSLSRSKAIPMSREYNDKEQKEVQTPTKPQSKERPKPRYSIAGVSPAVELGITKYVREEHNQIFSSSVGATDICKAMNPRLATVTGYNSTSSHTTGKHFSYYVNNNDSTTESSFKATGATSLLMACQALQLSKTKKLMSPRTVDKHTSEISNPFTTTDCKSPHFTCGPSKEEGILEDLTTLFERILYQTIECLADAQWELRRMAHQLLGCVVEVIRWYDMKILEDLWDNQLKPESNLLSYGVCEALKYSVAHAARLHHLVKSPPASWRDVKLCERIIMQIVDPIRLKVGVWSQIVYMVLQERTEYDKFTVVAMETLMLVQSHFELLTGQKYAQLNRMVSVIKEVFTKSHPESQLCKNLMQATLLKKRFSTPTEGFLSCSMRKEPHEVAQAKQVEKYLLTELEHTLPHFLKVADVNRTHILLPVLCFYLGFYVQDDKLTKYIIDSILYLSGAVHQKIKVRSNSELDQILQSGVEATQELHTQLANTTLDEHTFKQVCEVYAIVCAHLPAELYLPSLVQTLAPRVKEASVQQPSCQKPVRDVVIQHIPLAPIMDGPNSTDEEEEDQIDPSVDHLSESQMLNTSVNSTGSGKGTNHHHHRHKVDAEDESEESDWDSWDEDVATDEDFTEAIKELFLKVQKIINNKKETKLKFKHHVEKLPNKEKQILCSLLQL